jgi:hypothetical protein
MRSRGNVSISGIALLAGDSAAPIECVGARGCEHGLGIAVTTLEGSYLGLGQAL